MCLKVRQILSSMCTQFQYGSVIKIKILAQIAAFPGPSFWSLTTGLASVPQTWHWVCWSLSFASGGTFSLLAPHLNTCPCSGHSLGRGSDLPLTSASPFSPPWSQTLFSVPVFTIWEFAANEHENRQLILLNIYHFLLACPCSCPKLGFLNSNTCKTSSSIS